MPHRPLKIDKTGGKSVDPLDNARSAQPNLSNNSFNKVFAASFKQMENMQVVFKKNLFNPAVSTPIRPAPVQTPADAGFKDIIKIVMKHEGVAYVRRDGGRESSKMGILQSTAVEYGYKGDIKNISKADAEAIYKKIWDKSGAAHLPYPLSVVHFDTYVNSPSAARKILKQSGGDINTYLKMREDRFIRLASARPERYGKYLNGWINRVNSLRSVVTEYAKTIDADKVKTAAAPHLNKTA
jgi:lysozyme family protein